MSRLHARSVFICSLFLTAVLYVGGPVVLAQVAASITGRIEDSSGAAVPNVNVTAKNLETGATRTVMADEAGNYQVLALPVGNYEVKAENTGFKAAVQTGINLVVGQQAVVNLKLEVGAVQEQVTVTSDAALVNTTTASIAGLVGEKEVKDLPLNGRSFDLLITLNPGTINFTINKGGPANTGGNLFSVAGRRGSENLTLMNGVEYTGAGNASVTPGGVSGLLGIDAVREYNVVSDGYGAEYGQRAGGQVSIITQSGSNQVHGTLFEFWRNNVLNAREFFAQGVPPFHRNQFGGSIGGPIRKDKTFIFGNYEAFRQASGLSFKTFVPDANARLGLLPCGFGAGYPTCGPGQPVSTPVQAVNLDPRILPFANGMWPVPNGPGGGGGIGFAFNSPAATDNTDFGTTRFDQRFSDKDSFSAVYTVNHDSSLTPGQVPIFGTGLNLQSQTGSMQEAHIFSPTVINTATAGYSRGVYNNQSAVLTNVPSSLDFVGGHSPGAITIGNVNVSTGFDMPGNQNPFVLFYRNLFTYTDGVQIIKGKHQISAGVWFQRIQDNDNYPLRASGSAAFASIPGFFQGMTTSFQVAPKTTANGWRSWEGAWYVQDSIQLRPNLTLRVGLRHEFSNGWSEVNGQAQVYLFDQSDVIQTLPRTGSEFNTANNSKLLFGPRIGLAWDPFGKGKTSIRAAFGTYYDQLDSLIYFVDQTPPLNGAATFGSAAAPVSLFSIIPVNTAAPLKPPCSPGVSTSLCNIYAPKGVQGSYKIPTVESWNFSVEQQLAHATALRLTYVGSHTYHQWVSIDPNTIQALICSNPAGCLAGGINPAQSTVAQGVAYVPALAPGKPATRPNPFLGSGFFAQSSAYGNYDALETEVIQRLSGGLQFRGSFTWAKNLDSGSGAIGGGTGTAQGHLVSNAQEYGLANFGIKAQASGNLSYQLPFGQGKRFLNGMHGVADKLVSGWQTNTIVTLVSGFPFGVTAGSNISGNGDANGTDRPNLVTGASNNPTSGVTAGCGGGIIPAGQQLHTPNLWFDPCAFVLPASGTFGNAGRNTMIGPGLADVDFSLFKNTKITERIGLQFRAEGFNILNHPNFKIPTSSAVFAGSAYSPSAGIITGTATMGRQIQLSLKLIF